MRTKRFRSLNKPFRESVSTLINSVDTFGTKHDEEINGSIERREEEESFEQYQECEQLIGKDGRSKVRFKDNSFLTKVRTFIKEGQHAIDHLNKQGPPEPSTNLE
mmetsp:Transcript_43005/g.31400  ORF Transcript_43005/g.31400 Transcript_43005/m.31400 type:complete len:105 (-) Transcript_43005:228-542(-)